MRSFALALYIGCLLTSVATAAVVRIPTMRGTSVAGAQWRTDYDAALQAAKGESRLLLIYFYDPKSDATGTKLELGIARFPQVSAQLKGYVCVKLPIGTEIQVQEEKTRLLDDPAFAALDGKAGIAILDFVQDGSPQYGKVVTAIPIGVSRSYRYQPEHLSVILGLPAGTLTQRTLIFAVRIHPEAPASALGEPDPGLVAEAQSHSEYQANNQALGHQDWESRFQRINRHLPGLLAQEVVAESWPQEGLLDAAIDCVRSWRQSADHWGAVRSRQSRFAFDMRQGRNGIWYATGIFGNQR